MNAMIRILHLEDDRVDAELVQANLAEAGLACRITIVQTRDAFETVLRNDGMDIILADYQLPMYDGISALLMAREVCPEIPFIFVSGTMGEEAAIAALTRGATDYVLKQNLSRLASAVRRALQEARDRRERKQAEQQVALMSFALNGIHEAAFMVDENGCFQYVNDEACRLLGYTRDELLTMGPQDIDPNISLERYAGYRNDLKAYGKLTFEGEMKAKDGRLFPVEINANYFVYEGQGYDLGLVRDITERKQAERERLANLRYFKSMDQVNRAIQGADDFEKMMKDLLDVVISIFDCDRAFLMYPCDPESPTWTSPMERNKPEYPGMRDLKIELAMDPQVAETLRVLLATDGPVAFGPGTHHALPGDVSRQFNVQSFMSMAIYPKTGSPWQFGMHQCAYARVWTAEEMRMFEAIGRRLADALSSLLTHRDLRRNEEFLDKVVEHIPDMIFVKDAQTLSFVRFNKAGEQLLGFPREALLGKNDYDFFPKEEADFFTGKDRQVLASKKLVDIPEETISTRSNEERILHTKKIPILDESGRPQYLLGISEDITARKRAEEKMLRSDQRLRLHREQSPLGFLEFDENFRVVEWNTACERIFGYTREEAIGRHAKDLILPEEVHELCDGIYQSLMNQTGGQRSINKNVAKDGRIIICEWFNTTLVDKDGKAIGVASICNDITEQMQAEESIRKLSQAVEQSPVSIVITDVDGNIEFVNAKFTQITGYTYTEALGQNPRILKSGETPAEEYRRLWKTIRSGGVWRGEFHNRKKSGELFWEQATIAPIRDADNVITHYVAVKEDITERKKLEAQLRQVQKMEAIGQLAGGIAHDFNNILSAITGYTELSVSILEPESQASEHLAQVMEASGRAKDLINQILMFSRETDQELRPTRVSFPVKEALKLIRASVPATIEIRTKILSKSYALADPTQLHQIVMNLCTNAAQSMQDSSGVLEVHLTDITVVHGDHRQDFPDAKPGEYIRLTVSDQGHGIDAQYIHRIFDPFFTTKKRGQGTGLGLSVVHGIVKSHGGFIYARSRLGEGSTFEILIPAQEPVASQDAIPEMPIPTGSESILLVDDETMIVDIVQQMLESLGYRVVARTSALEALEAFKSMPDSFDLVVTDMTMPKMSGLDLAEKILQIRPEFPIVLCTGFDVSMNEEKIAERGLKDIIYKPILRRDMATVVRKTLDSRRSTKGDK